MAELCQSLNTLFSFVGSRRNTECPGFPTKGFHHYPNHFFFFPVTSSIMATLSGNGFFISYLCPLLHGFLLPEPHLGFGVTTSNGIDSSVAFLSPLTAALFPSSFPVCLPLSHISSGLPPLSLPVQKLSFIPL